MASIDSDEVITAENAEEKCKDNDLMIDLNTNLLQKYRRIKVDTITKQEIQTVEGKLIKYFSKQLDIKAKFGKEIDLGNYPSLSKWLVVVGITKESAKVIENSMNTLEDLKAKTDADLERYISQASISYSERKEDAHRLTKSLHNLKRYTDILKNGSKSDNIELHWTIKWDNKTRETSESYQSHIERRLYDQSKSCPKMMTGPRTITSNHFKPPTCYRDESSSPKHESSSKCDSDSSSGVPTTPTSKAFPKMDSISSSPSSSGNSIPPPSPGVILSPPIVQQPITSIWDQMQQPSTPPFTISTSGAGGNKQNPTLPGTPPAKRKLSTGPIPAGILKVENALHGISKSKSHESELGNRIITQSTSSNRPELSIPGTYLTANDNSEYHSVITRPTSEYIRPTTSTTSSLTSSNMVLIPSHSMRPITNSVSGDMPNITNYTEDDDTIFAPPGTISGTPRGMFRQDRLPTDPHGMSYLNTFDSQPGLSPISSPGNKTTNKFFDPNDLPIHSSTLQVPPKSPKTPSQRQFAHGQMGHAIPHQFNKTFKPGKCNFCSEYMFNGFKCKACKFRCHRDCQHLVPPSCGLSEELMNAYLSQLQISTPSPNLRGSASSSVSTIQPFPNSSSNTSSCNSSTPSSPAVMITSQPTTPASASIYHNSNSGKTVFSFDHHITYQQENKNKISNSNSVVDSIKSSDTIKSTDSDKTLSGSSGSAGTAFRLDSQESTASVEDTGSVTWSASRVNSINAKEWDIPYESLTFVEKIGAGRFSEVHRGHWCGEVAIKVWDLTNTKDENDEAATLEAFRQDVATFRKTRHENVILFMGACMNPPKLAIVTSLCKGNTLYTHLHLRKVKFSLNKIIDVAQHIAQGMGYLHHRGIIHKDLKTKNIFLENGKAIITDFGLVNVANRLCATQIGGEYNNSFSALTERENMSIPKGWLCYLAPEIMHNLRVQSNEEEDLPFTKASDVFAFGTVWFELLTGEWPWKDQDPETIIYLVGKGMKPTMSALSASRDVKDILVMCWTFNSDSRPDFGFLSTNLEKVPKKRLARSPSHPVHLTTRSAESTF